MYCTRETEVCPSSITMRYITLHHLHTLSPTKNKHAHESLKASAFCTSFACCSDTHNFQRTVRARPPQDKSCCTPALHVGRPRAVAINNQQPSPMPVTRNGNFKTPPQPLSRPDSTNSFVQQLTAIFQGRNSTPSSSRSNSSSRLTIFTRRLAPTSNPTLRTLYATHREDAASTAHFRFCTSWHSHAFQAARLLSEPIDTPPTASSVCL